MPLVTYEGQEQVTAVLVAMGCTDLLIQAATGLSDRYVQGVRERYSKGEFSGRSDYQPDFRTNPRFCLEAVLLATIGGPGGRLSLPTALDRVAATGLDFSLTVLSTITQLSQKHLNPAVKKAAKAEIERAFADAEAELAGPAQALAPLVVRRGAGSVTGSAEKPKNPKRSRNSG